MSSERIEDEAIAWQVRLKDPSASTADHERFRQWLHASPAHGEAYRKAAALWGEMAEPARRLGAGGWYRARPARRAVLLRRRTGLAAACAVLLVAFLAWRDPGLAGRLTADFASPPGQSRETVLADGSTIFLGADSAVDVVLGAEERRVILRRGRAWFDVAHTGTPFLVEAGEAEIRVLGTAFAVERGPGAVSVVVERGRVAVGSTSRSDSAILDPGQAVMVGPDLPLAAPIAVEIGTALAWRRGLAVFDRVSVADIAAHLEQLRPGRVLVVGEDLRRQTLSGVFKADSPEAILAALGSGLGVQITDIPGVITVIHR